MKTYELRLPPQQFSALYDGTNTSVYIDRAVLPEVSAHVLVHEYAPGFTGRWVRLQITHIQHTRELRQILSVRMVARSAIKKAA